jgi:hypothetical protein
MPLHRVRAAIDRVAGVPPTETASNGGPDPSRFLRGVAIGALVGAAIAGSTIWQRRRVRGRIRRELIDDGGSTGS